MKTLSTLILISLSLTAFDGFGQTNVVISDGAAQAASMAAARSALQAASSNALQTATLTTLARCHNPKLNALADQSYMTEETFPTRSPSNLTPNSSPVPSNPISPTKTPGR